MEILQIIQTNSLENAEQKKKIKKKTPPPAPKHLTSFRVLGLQTILFSTESSICLFFFLLDGNGFYWS